MINLNNTKAEIFAALEESKKQLLKLQEQVDKTEKVSAENLIDFILAMPREEKKKILDQTYRTQKGWQFKTMILHNVIV